MLHSETATVQATELRKTLTAAFEAKGWNVVGDHTLYVQEGTNNVADVTVSVTRWDYSTVVMTTVNPGWSLKGFKKVSYRVGVNEDFVTTPEKVAKIVARVEAVRVARIAQATAADALRKARQADADKKAEALKPVEAFMTGHGIEVGYNKPVKEFAVNVWGGQPSFSVKLGDLTEAQLLAVLAVIK